MSEMVSNLNLEQAHNIADVLIKDGIIIDLIKLFPKINPQVNLGYYFCDRQEKIIAGKIINLQAQQDKNPTSWLTISCQEIPENAVTLSFFCD